MDANINPFRKRLSTWVGIYSGPFGPKTLHNRNKVAEWIDIAIRALFGASGTTEKLFGPNTSILNRGLFGDVFGTGGMTRMVRIPYSDPYSAQWNEAPS